MTPDNPVVGSTILRRPAIQSPNFVTGVSGWTINADGSAEFDNLVIRGTFDGTDFILTSNGFFLYSSTPALGNLAASIVPGTTTVTDPEGNTAEPGISSYSGSLIVNLNAGGVGIQFAAGQIAGGYQGVISAGAAAGEVVITSGGDTALDPQAEIELAAGSVAGTPTVTVSDDLTVQSNLQVDGNSLVSGTACLLTGHASVTAPSAAPSRTVLGSTWNATTAAQCNANFVAIINALGALGLFT